MLDYDAYCKLDLATAEDWRPMTKNEPEGNLHYEITFKKQRFGPQAEAQYLYLLSEEGRLVDEQTKHDIDTVK